MPDFALGDRVEVNLAGVWKDLAGLARGRVERVNVPPKGLVYPGPTEYLVWFDKFVFLREKDGLVKTDTRLTAVGEDDAEPWLQAHQMRKLSILELMAEVIAEAAAD